MPAMVIDRRSFLISGAAATLAALPSARVAAEQPASNRFAAVCRNGNGQFSAAVFGPTGESLAATPLPARGHDIAMRPHSTEAIVFARRPGRFAVVFDTTGRKPAQQFDCVEGRHFFGHGVYSTDGRLLFSTENDIAATRGVLGVRDVDAGYKPLGQFATGGIGPHDVALLSDRQTLVVANGGIETDPNGRADINVAAMQPSLALVDLKTGDMIERTELDESLRPNSIRHLAVGVGDRVVFGCQWQGSRMDHPPLVGIYRRGGKAVMLSAPADVIRRMNNYVGSIAVDASGEIAVATAPKGGLAVYWDVASGAYIGATELADVCGVTEAGRPNEILLSTGSGGRLRVEDIVEGRSITAVTDTAVSVEWDNHMIRV